MHSINISVDDKKTLKHMAKMFDRSERSGEKLAFAASSLAKLSQENPPSAATIREYIRLNQEALKAYEAAVQSAGVFVDEVKELLKL
jgi:hypothetical protein